MSKEPSHITVNKLEDLPAGCCFCVFEQGTKYESDGYGGTDACPFIIIKVFQTQHDQVEYLREKVEKIKSQKFGPLEAMPVGATVKRNIQVVMEIRDVS